MKNQFSDFYGENYGWVMVDFVLKNYLKIITKTTKSHNLKIAKSENWFFYTIHHIPHFSGSPGPLMLLDWEP